MEKDRRSKSLFILGLSILLLGTTLGFAAFSANLRVSSSATVTPNEVDFKVVASGSETDSSVDIVSPNTVGGASADDVVIVNEKGSSSANINVNFTEPGQSVTYQFFIHNEGEYDAHLKSLEFKNVIDSNSKKICNVVDGSDATVDLVNQACEDIEISVEIKNGSDFLEFKDSNTFENVTLLKGRVSSGKFNITYPDGSARADGAFNIQFGDIELTYSSAD